MTNKETLSGVKIRPFQSNDLDKVFSIMEKCLQDNERNDYVGPRDIFSQDTGTMVCFVADLNGEPIGFCLGTLFRNEQGTRVCEITEMGVLPEYRRMGVATKLVDRVVGHKYVDVTRLMFRTNAVRMANLVEKMAFYKLADIDRGMNLAPLYLFEKFNI